MKATPLAAAAIAGLIIGAGAGLTVSLAASSSPPSSPGVAGIFVVYPHLGWNIHQAGSTLIARRAKTSDFLRIGPGMTKQEFDDTAKDDVGAKPLIKDRLLGDISIYYRFTSLSSNRRVRIRGVLHRGHSWTPFEGEFLSTQQIVDQVLWMLRGVKEII